MVPLCRRLKDALSKHPFFQDDMAPFQSTGLAERSVGCISAPTHFLCQAPLYYAQVHTQRCRPWNSPILSLNCHIRGHLLLQSLNPPAAGMYQFFPARWEISKSLSHGRPFKHRHYFCAPPQSSHGTELPPWKEIQTAPKPRTNTVSLKARLQQSYHKGTGNTRKNSTDRDHDKFINTLKEAVKTWNVGERRSCRICKCMHLKEPQSLNNKEMGEKLKESWVERRGEHGEIIKHSRDGGLRVGTRTP